MGSADGGAAKTETGVQMTSIWVVFQALGGMTALVLFILTLNRWPVVAAVSIAINVAVAWEIPYPPPLLNVGGNSVYFLDVLSVALLVTALLRFSSLAHNLRTALWPWIGLGFLLAISLVTGLIENPFGTTMNEFRSFLQPYAAITWAMSLSWNQKAANALVRRFAVILGCCLTAVAGYHFAIYGLGSTSDFVDAGTGLEQTTRPLVSGQALVILLCGILCLWNWRRLGHKPLLVVAVIFFVVVIVTQQRTVWAVGLAALIVVFLAARAGSKALIAVFSLTAVWLVALLLSAQFMPQVISQLGAAAEDSGTYDARVRSWTDLIDQTVAKGPSSVIFGQPMGGGFGRFEGVGRWVEFAPHNWYVTIYLRVGIIGLGMLLLFLLIVLIALLKRRHNMGALAVFVIIIVYGWSYSWPWYVCIFLGWAIICGQSDSLSKEEDQPGPFGGHFKSRAAELWEARTKF